MLAVMDDDMDSKFPTLWRSRILNLKPSRSWSFFLWVQINDVQHKLNSTLVPSYCHSFSELVLECIAFHPIETTVSSCLMWFYYSLINTSLIFKRNQKAGKAWVDEKAQQGTQFHYQ